MEITPKILRQTHLSKILILLFCSVGIMSLHTLVPEGQEIRRFPFSDQFISLKSYVFNGSPIVARMIVLTLLAIAIPVIRVPLLILFASEVVYLADYLLRYNDTLFYFQDHEVNPGAVKLTFYGTIIGKTIWTL